MGTYFVRSKYAVLLLPKKFCCEDRGLENASGSGFFEVRVKVKGREGQVFGDQSEGERVAGVLSSVEAMRLADSLFAD